jgi:hypothetical protein
MSSEKIYNWHKLNNDEYSRTLYNNEKERVFLLRKGDVGVLGMGKGFRLLTKLKNESEFKNITCIVYASDNHGLSLHDDVKTFEVREKMVASLIPEKELSHLIFDIAEDYIHSLY